MTTFEFITNKTNKTTTETEKKIMRLINSVAKELYDKPFKSLSLPLKTETLTIVSIRLDDTKLMEKRGIDAQTTASLGKFIYSLAVNKIM